jgi:hypothetical protein
MEPSAFVAGTASVPANALLVYYKTVDYDLIKQYAGIEVTIDVVIYTFRSDQLAFAVYYVGGPTGVTANLSDEEKQIIDAGSLSIPLSIIVATKLELPDSGANETTIVWSFTDPTNLDNSRVDLSSGQVTPPVDSQVTVSITATISIGTIDPFIKIFVLKIGVYPVSTTLEAKTATADSVVRVVGIITATTDDVANGAYWLQDAAGAIGLFDPTNILGPSILGKTYDVIAPLSPFQGLIQLRITSLTQLVEITGQDALTMPSPLDISSLTLNPTTLLPLQGQLVNLNGFVLKTTLSATYTSSFSMNFVNSTGQEIVVRLDRDVPGFANFVAIVASATSGTAFNFEGLIVGWFNAPQLLVASTSKITVGTAYTNQQLLDTAASLFVAPSANDELTSNLSLPTTGLFGSTVAWSSSKEDVISTTGVVTRPAIGQPDVTVKLSYVITVGSVSSAPVEITFVVKAGEPIVTLYSADYGTTGRAGYGEGMIFQDNPTTNNWSNITRFNSDGVTANTSWNPAIHSVNKNRVQIGTSTGIHTRGAFLVFGPISTALVAYLEFDLSSIVNPGKLGFSYAIWSSTDGENFSNSTKVTSAVLSLEKFDGTNWVPLTPTLNLVANASATAYKSTSFDLTGAAKYRLVYTLAVPTGTSSSQNQRLTIDDVIVTDR